MPWLVTNDANSHDQVFGGAPAALRSPVVVDEAPPRRVWLWVDFATFERASGFWGRRLWSSWARWFVAAESRGGIWGDNIPKIAVVLEVLSRAPRGDASMSVSTFARGDGPVDVAAVFASALEWTAACLREALLVS